MPDIRLPFPKHAAVAVQTRDGARVVARDDVPGAALCKVRHDRPGGAPIDHVAEFEIPQPVAGRAVETVQHPFTIEQEYFRTRVARDVADRGRPAHAARMRHAPQLAAFAVERGYFAVHRCDDDFEVAVAVEIAHCGRRVNAAVRRAV